MVPRNFETPPTYANPKNVIDRGAVTRAAAQSMDILARRYPETEQQPDLIKEIPLPDKRTAPWRIPAMDRRQVSADLAELKDKLKNESDFEPLAAKLLAHAESRYVDRFAMPNGEYFAAEVFEQMSEFAATLADDKTRSQTAMAYAAAMERGEPVGPAVVFFDVNGLKTVNDVLGHAAGDAYLKLARDVFMEPEIKIAGASKMDAQCQTGLAGCANAGRVSSSDTRVETSSFCP